MTLAITKTRTETTTLYLGLTEGGGMLTKIDYRDPAPDELPLIARACLDAMTAEQRLELQLPTVEALTAERDRLCAKIEDLTRERDEAYRERNEAYRQHGEDEDRLEELRNAIDEHLGWPDEESRERGDYVARVVEVASELNDRAVFQHADKRYSGPDSEAFWNRVNALGGEEYEAMYSCGVLLQDMEERILQWLANAERNALPPNHHPKPETADTNLTIGASVGRRSDDGSPALLSKSEPDVRRVPRRVR